jgi:hypothetical protein
MADRFSLTEVFAGAKEQVQHGTWIVLLNPQELPPHLLVCHNSRLYSLSVSGRQLGSPLEKLMSWCERKNVPSLFIEWKTGMRDTIYFEELLNASFSRYARVEAGKNSCLFPVRDLAAKVHGEQMSQARFIFELLPLLQQKNSLGKSLAIGMEISDTRFELLSYSEEELARAIEKGILQD